jgi:6-phosphogluconolactonase
MNIPLLFLSMLAFSISNAQKKPYLLVGTYTSGKSEGIYVYDFDTKTASTNLVSIAKTSNPSYLAVAPNKKTVYAVNENADTTGAVAGGTVTAFSFNVTDGKLTEMGKQLSGGKHPCYVAVDKTGKWVYAGNYSSGTVAVFPVKGNGSVNAASEVIAQTGTGLNAERQEGSHVHATVVSPDNNFLFVPNLGADKVFIYKINNLTGKLTATAEKFAASDPGSGPRHFDFAPNGKYAYLMEELTGTVVVYKYNNGKLSRQQRINALPKDFTGDIGSADIHVSPDGKFLYCSNRGDANTITIFSISQQTGKLTETGYQSSQGKTPRNFNFDPSGNFLLVANQQSDNIVIFKIDKKTGLLTDTGKQIEVPNPICIKWIY